MRIIGIALVALAAGCSGSPNRTAAVDANDTASTDVIEVPPSESAPPLAGILENDEAAGPETEPTAPGSLPSANAEYRYVGRWAATQQLCDAGAWRFAPKRLDTAGEVSCTFDSVDKAPGGYDIAATCLADGKTSTDRIELRFAESAQAMLVSSKMWKGVGLTYCGAME